MYSVEFTKEARKTLVSMPRNVRDLIVNKIDDLARDPQAAQTSRNLQAVRVFAFASATGA